MTRALLVVGCLVAVGVSGLGCAAVAPGGAPERVLLSPVAFDQQFPTLPESGVSVVRAEMISMLAARNLEVLAPDPVEFLGVWASATQDLGEARDPRGRLDRVRLDEASRALMDGYRARNEELDVLLLAYFEVKPVQIRSWTASWDGVERRIRVDRNHGRRVSGLWPNDRDAPCLSLRVVAYSADGMRLFDEQGGLEVLSEYGAEKLEERARQDLFEDRASLREGVAVALAPLFAD